MSIATFEPPVDDIIPPIYYDAMPDRYAPAPALATKLFRHYRSRSRGRNVYLLYSGVITEAQPWDPDGTIIQKIFFGGHKIPITAAEQAALTAAGYGAYIY